MKPELSLPSFNQERQSVESNLGTEKIAINNSAEVSNDNNTEKYEQRPEIGALLTDVSLTTFLPAPVNDAQNDDLTTTIGTTPLVANDDDLIEKEWVDKAKKIVSETTNDPYGREEAVAKLQVDYLNKRYGRKLGVAE